MTTTGVSLVVVALVAAGVAVDFADALAVDGPHAAATTRTHDGPHRARTEGPRDSYVVLNGPAQVLHL